MKQNIVFFGSGDFVIPVVKKLLNHGLDLVITNDQNLKSELLKFCKENNLKTLIASSASDLTNNQSLITNHSLAILASYGAFIPDEINNLFTNGIINIHPSLLPKYKGPSPVQFAILNGEEITGATLIKLDSEVDHGPILSQKPYNLSGNETTQELLNILFEIGAEMVEELVIKLENEKELIETTQDHSKETWSYKIEKKDGMIDLSSIPQNELEIRNWKLEIARKVRAYYPWPTVWFRAPSPLGEGEEKINFKLSGKLIKLLPEGKIQVEGKREMSYKDFINGYGEEGKEILEKFGIN